MSCPARSAKEGAAGDGSPARERAKRSASLPRHDEPHQRRDEPHSERCGGELRHTQIPVREPAGAELLRVLRRHPRVRALWAVSWFRDGRRRALRFLAPLLESLEDRWAKVVSTRTQIVYASGALQYPVRYHKLR